MLYIVTAENRRLFENDLIEMHRQRKSVFVDRFGWKVPVVGDMEIDEYDREDTIYLLAECDGKGALQASARLLPTTRRHLMSDLFTAACGAGVPRGPAIWEASRFCTAPGLSERGTRLSLLWEIICGVMEAALLFGVDEVTFVAGSALLPLAIDCGWDTRILGPTVRGDEGEITAVSASITTEGLRRVRQRFGIDAPVSRFHAAAPASAGLRSHAFALGRTTNTSSPPPCVTAKVSGVQS